MQTSAREVLAQVAMDLRKRGLKHEDIARDLDYKTRQSIGTILTSDRYMTPAQARRFCKAYGYHYEFLVSGAGSLNGPEEDEGTTFLVPKYALLLRPFESYEKFEEAYEVLMRGLIASYGAQNVQRFLGDTIRYIAFVGNPEEEWAKTQQSVDKDGNVHDPRESKIAKMDPDYIQRNIEAWKSLITYKLYDSYNKMIAKDLEKDKQD